MRNKLNNDALLGRSLPSTLKSAYRIASNYLVVVGDCIVVADEVRIREQRDRRNSRKAHRCEYQSTISLQDTVPAYADISERLGFQAVQAYGKHGWFIIKCCMRFAYDHHDTVEEYEKSLRDDMVLMFRPDEAESGERSLRRCSTSILKRIRMVKRRCSEVFTL